MAAPALLPTAAAIESDRFKRPRSVRPLTPGGLARFVACVVIALIVVTPLVVAAVNGFRTNPKVLSQPIALPDPLITSNYGAILGNPLFWRQVLNSVLVM